MQLSSLIQYNDKNSIDKIDIQHLKACIAVYCTFFCWRVGAGSRCAGSRFDWFCF